MFANAVSIAEKFTRAVLVSIRQLSGKVETFCGTYVILNSQGWILTAAHNLGPAVKAGQDKPLIEAFLTKEAAINSNNSLSKSKKQKKIRALEPDLNWISDVSYYWGDNVVVATNHCDFTRDLAVVKLDNLNLPADQIYPTFGNATVELPQGRSLCKLGFPFHEFKTEFEEATGFSIKEEVALVKYPLDGIVTRYLNIVLVPGSNACRFIEISTPGLKGQSGGPCFDVNGVVWGIQSRTHHLPLGFSPSADVGGKKVVEHQFLNAGAATYISEIVPFLQSHNVTFQFA